MKQFKLTFVLTFLMSMVGAKAFALDAVIGGICYNFSESGATVTYYSSDPITNYEYYRGDIVIPESVTYGGKNYIVTSVGLSAFKFCADLTSITIPNSVTSIGTFAFYGCPGLTSVTIPNSLTSIGNYAFDYCKGLTSITIPNSVTSIGYKAFAVTAWYNNLPDGLVYVGKVAYCYKGTMPANTSISIIDGTLGIAGGAFEDCSGLTSVTIPNSVTSIGSGAFNTCSSLTYVTIGNSVTSIGEGAFEDCSGLTSVTLNSNAIVSKNYTSSSNLKNIFGNQVAGYTIGDEVTSIGGYAFYGCSGLQSIVIGNGITELNVISIYTGSKLKSLTIGSGVLSIKNSSPSTLPIKIIWLTNTPPSGYTNLVGKMNYVSNDSYTSLNNKMVYSFLSSIFEVDGIKYVPVSPSERTCDAIDCVYDESAEIINIGKSVSYKEIAMTIKNVNPYVCFENPFIKEVNLSSEGHLGNYAFQRCTGINDVTVNNQGSIGSYAFQGCTGIIDATINNQGNIGSYAFQGCKGMKTVTLGEMITSIDQYAFNGCSSLQNIVVPDAVILLGSYVFGNCSGMTSAQIGSGVSIINSYTFSGCSSLTDIQIGGNVKTIGEDAFSNCNSLPYIYIPQSVTNINDDAFYGCTSLKNVTMEDRLNDDTPLTLGSNDSSPIFSSCPLDEVYIGRNISYSTQSSKGYSPFYRNTSLRSVTITDKETEISPNEFYGCTNLQNVTIGDGVTTIGDWAFSGCSSLDYFAFGTKVKTIGKEAFSDCTAMTKLISKAITPPVCGDQALDDINKWSCTLQVLPGSIDSYKVADQWKDFFFMEAVGIKDITTDKATEEIENCCYYDLNGHQLLQPRKGVNIVKMSNGTTKKVVVK